MKPLMHAIGTGFYFGAYLALSFLATLCAVFFFGSRAKVPNELSNSDE